jgi:hypothetical protein
MEIRAAEPAGFGESHEKPPEFHPEWGLSVGIVGVPTLFPLGSSVAATEH